jgi:hypothetical protein
MRPQYLQSIREACIKANPEKNWKGFKYGKLGVINATCGLADVLLAIWKANPANRTNITVESSGQFIYITYDDAGAYKNAGPEWNLRKDDLTEQSDESLAFLADLLK